MKAKRRKMSGNHRRSKRHWLTASRASHELVELNRIGIALSETRDVDRLLEMILNKTREITSADAGSLYLVERGADEARLRFKLTQNDSVEFPFAEFTLPLTDQSIAGYCAWHGQAVELADAYRVPKAMPLHLNKSFDEQARTRTRAVLTLAIQNG